MDVTRLISDLHSELKQIDQEIQSLEQPDARTNGSSEPSPEEIGRETSGGS